MTPIQELHASKGRKITRLAWALESVVVLTALGLGATILISGAAENVSIDAKVVALMPLLAAAAIEFAKIPLASAVVFARWYLKPVATILLLGVAFSTFETLFQGFEHGANIRISKVTHVQTELAALEGNREAFYTQVERRSNTTSLENERIAEQIVSLRGQNDQYRHEIEALVTGANDPKAIALKNALDVAAAELTAIKQERLDAVKAAGDEWQSTSDQYRERIAAGGQDGAYAQRLQAGMPAKNRVMTDAGKVWDTANGDRFSGTIQELDEINAELKAYLRNSGVLDQSRVSELQAKIEENEDRIAALNDQAGSLSFLEYEDQAPETIADLDQEILKASTEVILLAGASNVYRFAGLIFDKRTEDVSAPEARKAAAWFWGTLAVVLALGTSGLAMIGAHHTSLSMDKRTPNERRLISSRWNRKERVEVIREVPTIKYVWYPTAETVQTTPETLSLNPFGKGERNAA